MSLQPDMIQWLQIRKSLLILLNILVMLMQFNIHLYRIKLDSFSAFYVTWEDMAAVVGDPESRPTLSFMLETVLTSKFDSVHGRILDTILFPVTLRNTIMYI